MPEAPEAPPAPAKETAKKGPDPLRFLKKSRSVLVFRLIDAKLTRDVTTQLRILYSLSKTKPIRVYVNSPGGLADDGFAIYDLLRYVRAPVSTIVTGMAASAATILLLGAAKGRRFIM